VPDEKHTKERPPVLIVWVVVVVAALLVSGEMARREGVEAVRRAVLFSAQQPGCAIVIPAAPSDAERRAAQVMQSALAMASGRTAGEFPIQEERGAAPRGAVWIGATRRGRQVVRPERRAPFDTGVGCAVRGGEVFLKGERAGAIEGAVGWFLEKHLGAQWYLPGPLGEHVPRRTELTVSAGEERARPGFVHRDLGLEGGPETRAWYGANRLEARFEHGHNLSTIFQPEDFQREPEMAPIRAGQRYLPPRGSGNWQPNLLSEAAVRHAAAVANRVFDQDPDRLSFSLSINDTDLYDESAATLAAVSPPRFFRHRPDYSNLVFGFTNKVAALVAQRHPDRWLPAYAYYWCENTPDFRIEPNVVPFLTADRSQWSHPAFAVEDRALIERWCRSGARIVGSYDYYYGAPHFAPRPTLYTVAESIPFQHRAGVRAFYAETYANWALDGPKPWLAAKLLWSPERNPAELLDQYYREFWAEAAEPMRGFFAVAERTWKEQPGPALWLRFFKDEDQSWIYPPARRAELRAQLDAAARLAQTAVVRARVDLVQAGFSVSEAYWQFADARAAASRAARAGADPQALLEAWRRYRAARAEFVWRYGLVRRQQPLALAPQDLEIYLRNEPDSRIARELGRSAPGRSLLEANAHLPRVLVGASARELTRLPSEGEEVLADPGWREVVAGRVGGSADNFWTPPGAPWMGGGEAWEGRQVDLKSEADGRRVLRMASCRTESIGQWVPALPGALYAGTVKVRAKTSPGTATYLIVTFLDDRGAHVDLGRADRLPAGDGVQETELWVITRAPWNARHVGFAVRVLNQINDDFAEFSSASLRRL
jgi:hypothetical protein